MSADLLSLPFFDDQHRAFVADLDDRARKVAWPDPEKDDAAAMRHAVKTLAGWGTLKHAVGEPLVRHSPKGDGGWKLIYNVLARETLAYHSGIADLAYVMQVLGSLPVQLMGAESTKSVLLPKVVSGEAIMAIAMTEPEAGSDVGAMTTRAAPDGNGYRISGLKHLISNAGVATHYSVFARTGEGKKGISAFVVDARAPGLKIELQRPTSPHPLGKLTFDGVAVPSSARLGAEGDGLKLAYMTLERARTTVGAAANGFARRALDETIKHLKARKLFGKMLGEQPIAQGMLAQMNARLDASRLLAYRSAWTFDRGAPRITREAALAKWQSTENAQWIIDAAVQLAGGQGVLHGHILERLYREIRPLRIYEGASEVQQLVIAHDVLHGQTK
ncbi:MAG: acyl-CoA dehydrogenase [Planctomycetes bacterium]|nr:acyl-CoA dehydrogenase [Planctomycetota bacterium]